ncbi:MAG: bleomycin resistance protein [Devosia sp.]
MLPALTPELAVSDIGRSLAFYCQVLGFAVRYKRLEEGFACIELGAAVLMLDQLGLGRDWVTGKLESPNGRGINLQIHIESLAPVLERLATSQIGLFQPVESKSYQVGDRLAVQRQFCVQDPDGYLLRFCEEA